MTGGKSGYKGYTYQALVFLNELLSEDALTGELEKGDDFIIKKNNNSTVCYQTKDYSGPVKGSDVKKFIPNFVSAYKKGIRDFVIVSPYGLVKALNWIKLFDDLIKSKKVSKKDLTLRDNVIKVIRVDKKSRGEIEAELKIKISDIIKDDGGSILSDETVEIYLNILGDFYNKQEEVHRASVIEKIKKGGIPFATQVPKDCVKNSSDLIVKYLEEKFEKKLSESAVHFLVKFYFKKKRLAQNPSLLNKFTELYCLICEEIKSKKLSKISFKDYEKLIKKILSNKNDFELENFIGADNSISKEMYNHMIGECHFRPKNETNND